jgi:hypothetical protein
MTRTLTKSNNQSNYGVLVSFERTGQQHGNSRDLHSMHLLRLDANRPIKPMHKQSGKQKQN